MTELITIGKIINTHGHKGELKVMPLTDFPDRFKNTGRVTLNLGGRQTVGHITSARSHRGFIIISLKEISDMNAALELKGALIQVAREELQPLPQGEYYIFEIIGLKVFDSAGNNLGIVVDVLKTGSNDVYVVRNEENRDLLIPALKKVVREIDVVQQRMTVKLLEGMEP